MEEASPIHPPPTAENSKMNLRLSKEMRRCITALDITETPLVRLPRPKGARKGTRSKKEKWRWVWTIDNQDGKESETLQETLLPIAVFDEKVPPVKWCTAPYNLRAELTSSLNATSGDLILRLEKH
ncbi:hypothetical protein DL766_005208 [Monosporascus sp. MC13-8B]|uniref:Uncharacterized protein n=1 Tax=Monosporascus cannonballus TaxID=155416 RepID=A0ABY0GU15_9PEZI|nr:hypothetical protein DL763_011262 [Monosporascus cannonballus]RYO77153.1 hypothetical protein DL762_009451 [Monosporascus cannonballus]RYP29782.1 hypothetical protein DL766_005208 [Monosporascus sp. MC13-8B]